MLAGCTYSTQTATLAAAAAEVRTDQRINAPAILSFDPQYDSLTKDAEKNSFECSAHRYPSTVGPAIKQSVAKAFEAVFSQVDMTTNAESNPDAVVVRIRHEAYNPVVSFSSGFWSGKANAQSEIVMRVSAERGGHSLMYPVVVSGQGSSMGVSGGCGTGSKALDEANKNALQRLMENLAYRVINNGDLKRAVEGGGVGKPN
nr:J440 [uncultured bacterium]